MKKIAILILLAMLMVSCSAEGPGEDASAENAGNAAQTTQQTEEEPEAFPELPDVTYDGYTYRILTREEDYHCICSNETKGNIVDDTLYSVNQKVGDLLDVKFENVACGFMDINIARNAITANDDTFDVSYLHDCATAQAAIEGFFLNINDLKYVDTSAEWWPRFTVDSLTLNGKMYCFSNYSSYFPMMSTKAVFFNSDLIQQFALENPYDLVRAGTWTIDKLSELSKDTYIDSDGNGRRIKGDIFGFGYTAFPYTWLESFGIEAYAKTPGSSELTLILNNEQVYSLVDKIHNWLFTDGAGIWCKFEDPALNQPEESRGMFTDGQVAFVIDNIGPMVTAIADSDVYYGIVPFPKIDETVKEYYGGCNDWLFAVPSTAPNPDRTGAIIEMMAYYGYKEVLPAYCETTLKARYSTNEDCTEMLNIIFKNQVLSFAYLFANSVPVGMQYGLLYDTAVNNDLASYYAQNEGKELAFMKKLTEFYAGN